ncbi:hypothetical protein LEQ35_07535 [Lactiplantibacillus argentoratensis]|uniref:hypothetical protein n=1 Tax=Lactiplantibacillus argentoratensis TaxID=271881 RepID=UPI001CE0E732|nr:hypothetical protein [Lactiplantibacillus argentoratensis]MCA5598432.1 hypothetical protein [Lactiplantibacillus argentoratensis]
MKIIFSTSPANQAAAYALRQAVFVEERGISADVEFDVKDTDQREYARSLFATRFASCNVTPRTTN